MRLPRRLTRRDDRDNREKMRLGGFLLAWAREAQRKGNAEHFLEGLSPLTGREHRGSLGQAIQEYRRWRGRHQPHRWTARLEADGLLVLHRRRA